MRVPARAARCGRTRAIILLRKIDAAGRPVRQIEFCDRHATVMIARQRARGFEIYDRREMTDDGRWLERSDRVGRGTYQFGFELKREIIKKREITMIDIRVTHPNHADATAAAGNCLEKARVIHGIKGDRISFVDAIQFENGSIALKAADFAISNYGTLTDYSN